MEKGSSVTDICFVQALLLHIETYTSACGSYSVMGAFPYCISHYNAFYITIDFGKKMASKRQILLASVMLGLVILLSACSENQESEESAVDLDKAAADSYVSGIFPAPESNKCAVCNEYEYNLQRYKLIAYEVVESMDGEVRRARIARGE